jgi:divalent metal cation (Fe/Co/Zn/Cd) transporter
MTAMSGTHPALSDLHTGAALLGVCASIEAFSLFYAWRQCQGEAKRLGVSPSAYAFDSAADPRTVFIIAEDASALVSCAIGGTALVLAEMMPSASALWDAAGALGIASVLFLQFVFALRRTISAVNSPAVSPNLMKAVEALILADHAVSSVHDVKATVIGPFAFRFKAEVLIIFFPRYL